MRRGLRLRTLGLILILGSFATALAAGWLWYASTDAWQRHLTRAQVTGMALFESLRTGAAPPEGVEIRPLGPLENALADRGEFARLPGLPTPARVTVASIIGPSRDPVSGEVLQLGIVSPDLQYAVSELALQVGQPAAQKLGQVTRLLATYCTEPLVFARLSGGVWQRVDGTAVWGCTAAPRDLRLAAILLSLVSLAVLGTLVMDTSAHFDRFARALRDRRRLGGPESYAVEGPEELRDIVQAVNSYLEAEREQLSNRAVVLSGVSHDLGTPATRLRLRAALIEQADLRQKLEADIDSMTEMIESVLTYTRAELNAETPRQLSLASLVEALVADYQDMGRPVELGAPQDRRVTGGRSVFASTTGQGAVPEMHRILVTARPVSLKRAIANLIDNALKYGRRATVQLSATAEHAVIAVEDEGSGMSAEDIAAVVAPFKRGQNTASVDGFGLGLTIVATVAEQHGGGLTFENGRHGLRARIQIRRS